MSIVSAIFLGLIQGLAEFLPISSSGHLSVLQNFFHLQTAEDGHLFFDVLLHLGTLVAVVAAYWTDIVCIVTDSLRFVKDVRHNVDTTRRRYVGGRLLLMMFFATLPLAVILPINDRIETLYYKTGFIGAAFLITGCILYVSDRMPRGKKNEKTMRVLDAILIGICQAVATLPGISRSGSTITGALATGHEREFSVKFSLLLSLPAVLGANLLQLLDALKEGIDTSLIPAYLAGMVTAAVSGYFAIVLLRRMIRKGSFGRFAYYMWIMGGITLILSLFR